MALLPNISANIKSLIDYSDPVKTLTAIMTGLKVPKPNIDMVLSYASNKKNNPQYLDAMINLIMTYYTRFQTDYSTLSQEVYYDYYDVEKKIIYLESITVNPLTGQPYGFGSVDLQTGEVYQDGVLVKVIPTTLTRMGYNPTNNPTTNTNGLLVFAGVGLALWALKKRKKTKNK